MPPIDLNPTLRRLSHADIGQTLMDVLDYLEIIDLGLNLSATALHQLKEKQNG